MSLHGGSLGGATASLSAHQTPFPFLCLGLGVSVGCGICPPAISNERSCSIYATIGLEIQAWTVTHSPDGIAENRGRKKQGLS